MATTIIGLGIDPNKPKGEHEAEPRLEVVRQGIVPLPKPEQPNEPAQMPKVIVDLTDDSPAKRRARRKWQTYDAIGLPPPALEPAKHHDDAGPAPTYIHKVASKLVVSTYRLMGFAILTTIVVALVSYIASTLFYYGSHSWMVPTAISTSDEKVVQMRSELANLLERHLAAFDIGRDRLRVFVLERALGEDRFVDARQVRGDRVAVILLRGELAAHLHDLLVTGRDRGRHHPAVAAVIEQRARDVADERDDDDRQDREAHQAIGRDDELARNLVDVRRRGAGIIVVLRRLELGRRQPDIVIGLPLATCAALRG